jgi:hypothetical protein
MPVGLQLTGETGTEADRAADDLPCLSWNLRTAAEEDSCQEIRDGLGAEDARVYN